jgi:hypothetical protein
MKLSFMLTCATLLTSASLANAQNVFGLIFQMGEGTSFETDVHNVTQAGYLAVYPIVDAQADSPLGFGPVERGTIVDRRIRFNPRDLVFEPFWRGEEDGRGSGLGLAVVAEIVRHHASTIRIEETAGGGATFVVTFPEEGRGSDPEATPQPGSR